MRRRKILRLNYFFLVFFSKFQKLSVCSFIYETTYGSLTVQNKEKQQTENFWNSEKTQKK